MSCKLHALSASVFLSVSMMAGAHHSTRVNYQMDTIIELSGTVTDFRWSNPHGQIFVDVVDEDGETVNWAVELGSPGNWERNGWDHRTFQPGDDISFRMHPSRSGQPVGFPEEITMADGTVVSSSGSIIRETSEQE